MSLHLYIGTVRCIIYQAFVEGVFVVFSLLSATDTGVVDENHITQHRCALTFKGGNGLQDAKLLKNCHEKDDDHADGKQLHALDPHDFRLAAPQGQAFKAWPREGDEIKSEQARAKRSPPSPQQQVFSRGFGNQSGWWVPGPGDNMRARPVSRMKAALKSTPMAKWKICESRHIWKTSLRRPMRENRGCVISHLLQCIKRDV